MDTSVIIVLAVIAGAVAGAVLVRRFGSANEPGAGSADIAVLEERVRQKETESALLKAELEKRFAENTALIAENERVKARAEAESRSSAEKIALLAEAEKKLADAFKSLSASALKSNNESFITLAKQFIEHHQTASKGNLDRHQQALNEMLKPIGAELEKLKTSTAELERKRAEAYGGITELIRGVQETGGKLQQETGKLVKALSSPTARGQWGELQLKRVVELAGMVNYCDFEEQATRKTGDDKNIRPDMIVRLPNNRRIVVDAKTPLTSYISAMEAGTEEERLTLLASHAAQVKNHINQLAAKKYWESIGETADFVVLFLPGENFYQAALEQDHSLLEYGIENKVLVVTPASLVALLKAVAYGWRQEAVTKNAEGIVLHAKTLLERLDKFSEFFNTLGTKLRQASEAFNSASASYNRNLLSQARKVSKLGVASDDNASADIGEIPVDVTLLKSTGIASSAGDEADPETLARQIAE